MTHSVARPASGGGAAPEAFGFTPKSEGGQPLFGSPLRLLKPNTSAPLNSPAVTTQQGQSGAHASSAAGPTAAPSDANAVVGEDAGPAPEPTPSDVVTTSDEEGGTAPPGGTVPAPQGTGGAVTVNVGTLGAGDSVVITFQAVIDNAGGFSQVSAQGSVSGTNFSAVSTDDPAPPPGFPTAGANPTVTLVAQPPDVVVRDARVAEPQSGSSNMVFTVTLSAPAPASGASVNFTTEDEPSGPGKAAAGSDYTPTSGAVSFAPGQRVKAVSVPVLPDADSSEPDETFLVKLSGAAGGNVTDATATGTITAADAPGTFLISELRSSGPGAGGAGDTSDDYVELYNDSDSPLTVQAADASAGWALVASNNGCTGDPQVVGVIPNGTVIPARGHYLLTGSGYSLTSYASGNLTLSSGLGMDVNVAVFSTADPANLSSVNRLDAVGFGLNNSGLCDLLREGSTLGAANNSASQHAFVRRFTLVGTNVPTPTDQNDNQADFHVVSTTPAVAVGANPAPLLGAPGPEASGSPSLKKYAQVGAQVLDPAVSQGAAPNRVRDAAPHACNGGASPSNCALGTLSIRRTFTNTTGGPVTRLRFRVYDVTAYPSPAGTADLRALSSSQLVGVTTSGGPVTVQGTTLEGPAQPSGGAMNSSLSAGTVTMASQLASGASVSVQFLFGVQQPGSFRVFVFVEALP